MRNSMKNKIKKQPKLKHKYCKEDFYLSNIYDETDRKLKITHHNHTITLETEEKNYEVNFSLDEDSDRKLILFAQNLIELALKILKEN